MAGMSNMAMAGMNGMSPMSSMANMGMHNMSSMGQMPNNMGINKMASMQGGMQGPNNQMYPRRLAPYPSPALHMSQKRGNYNSGPQPGFNPNSPQYPTYGNGRPGFQNQYPPQQTLGPTGNFPGTMRNTGTMRQTTPPYTTSGQYFPTGQMGGGPGAGFPSHHSGAQYGVSNGVASAGGYGAPNSQFQQDVSSMRNNMNYQHSPIPGNPTPPLTPATSMPPYISPNPDVKPNFNELKPPMPIQSKYTHKFNYLVLDVTLVTQLILHTTVFLNITVRCQPCCDFNFLLLILEYFFRRR